MQLGDKVTTLSSDVRGVKTALESIMDNQSLLVRLVLHVLRGRTALEKVRSDPSSSTR